MKGRTLARIAAGAGIAAALTVPAFAGGLEDFGIDLDRVLGRGGSGGTIALAEKILESELPKHVGPARSYQVKIDRQGSDLLGGRLSGVAVTGTDVRTSDGLVIPRMELRLEDVKLGLGARRLESIGKGDFSLGLAGDVVTRYVVKRTGIRDVKVSLRDGDLLVRGTPELLGVPLRSEVAGRPEVRAGSRVDFRASRVAIAGLRLPRFAVDSLERKVNPVVDLTGLNLPVRITDLDVRGGRLEIAGEAALKPLRRLKK